MSEYFLNSSADYRLMSQIGVKQYVFPMNSTHNAIWDSNIDPEGRLYFGLASELFTSGYVRLCEYDYEKNEVITHFKVEDVILPNDRTIRASKFHTSIHFMPNGKIIMTTHTTDKSPAHPTWMPFAYYNHIWEGFPGSHIIVYDPVSRKAETLGIPVMRESIYGSLYEPRHNALYFLGFMKGHLYRYSLDDKKLTDFGKVTENYSFRLVLGPDGNIYGSTRTGYMYKVDTDKLKIIDMNYRLPHDNYTFGTEYNNMSVARIGPDERLYIAVMYGRDIIALDTKTGKFENMGSYLPTRNYIHVENRNGIFGMDFDSKGNLWYAVSSKNDGGTKPENGLPGSLFVWDITKHEKPKWAGLLGTKERVGAWISEIDITKDDILYAIGSNHSLDGPDIIAIDLKVFMPTIDNMSNVIEDKFYDSCAPRYIESSKVLFEHEKISADNPVSFKGLIEKPPIRLYRVLAPEHIEDSGVVGFVWDEKNNLYGICGEKTKFAFKISNMVLEKIERLDLLSEEKCIWLETSIMPQSSKFHTDLKLPSYPGRQYKAVASIDIEFSNNRRIVGTLDGMLAIISDDSVFSLGPVSPNGPIHAMTTNPDKTILYGVAGDKDDIGSVFTYDDRNGLVWRGIVYYTAPDHVGSVCCTRLSACAISPDGKYLAIGSNDRLGTVLIYTL